MSFLAMERDRPYWRKSGSPTRGVVVFAIADLDAGAPGRRERAPTQIPRYASWCASPVRWRRSTSSCVSAQRKSCEEFEATLELFARVLGVLRNSDQHHPS